MANETVITVVGNIGGPPELKFTPSGAAVCNFSIGSTPRTFDKNSNEWVDGETLWLRCALWREAAENAAESLEKGMRVIVQGRLKSRSYETKEGERRTVTELEVDEVGPSLKYASAKVNRTQKGGQGSGGFGRGQGSPAPGGAQGGPGGFGGSPGGAGGFGGSQGRAQGAQTSDPWGQSQGSLGGDGWGQGQEEEPPF